jgi:thioredoxin-dependent peroxiredoxin
MATSTILKVGERAPEFELADQRGAVVSLASMRERGPVVVYFYPRDNTPVCTAEACAFRDVSRTLIDAGASVVGISRDDVDSHARFAEEHALPFALLSDPHGGVAKSYGVRKTLGLFPGRATFVIDRDGIVRERFSSQLEARRHVNVALEAVRQLAH